MTFSNPARGAAAAAGRLRAGAARGPRGARSARGAGGARRLARPSFLGRAGRRAQAARGAGQVVGGRRGAAPGGFRARPRLPDAHDPHRGPACDPGLRPGPVGGDVPLPGGASRRSPSAAPCAPHGEPPRPAAARPGGDGARGDAQRAWTGEPGPSHQADGCARPGAPAADRSHSEHAERRENGLSGVRLHPRAHPRRRSRGNPHASSRHHPHARLHAGGHPWRRPRPQCRRRPPHRRADHPRQHLSPAHPPW